MNKQEFLGKLDKSLKENNVNEREDILSEYEEHFRFKLSDGYSEEEIAAKLGNPEALAKQFEPDTEGKKKTTGNKLVTAVGLGFADFFMATVFIMLFAWVFAMAAASVSFLAIGVSLIGKIEIYNIIPEMPYACAAIFAVSFLALSVLTSVGTIYCYRFFRQLIRAYCRFHKNTFAACKGEPVYPSLSMHPKLNRKFRTTALVSLIIFVLGFIAAYVVSAFNAGAIEFWHVWNWFV